MFDKSIYIARRKVLASKISSGVVLMLGNSEAGCNYTDNTYVFRQDSTFLYYFGLDKPDLAAVIDVESGEEIIFGDDVEIGDIIWMGPQPFLKDQAAEVGVAKTAPLAKLDDYVKNATAKGRKVHFIPQYRYHNMIQLNRMLGIPFEDMKKAPSLELILAVVSQGLLYQSRRGSGMAHHHTLAVMNVFDSLCRLRHFPSVVFFPVHICYIITLLYSNVNTLTHTHIHFGAMRYRVMVIFKLRKRTIGTTVEQMAFDAKALSETKRQVSWLSLPFRHLLRHLSPMAFRRRKTL